MAPGRAHYFPRRHHVILCLLELSRLCVTLAASPPHHVHDSPDHTNVRQLKRDTASCPAANGTLITRGDGHQYALYCGSSFEGLDIPAVHTNSFDECLQACDEYPPSQSVEGGAACVGATFGSGNRGGNCYLKYGIGNISTSDSNLQSGRQLPYQSPANSPVPAIQPLSTEVSPANTSKTHHVPIEYVYRILRVYARATLWLKS